MLETAAKVSVFALIILSLSWIVFCLSAASGLISWRQIDNISVQAERNE